MAAPDRLRTDIQTDPIPLLPGQQEPPILLPFVDDYIQRLIRPAVAAMVEKPKQRGGRKERVILDLAPPRDTPGWDEAAVMAAVQDEREALPDFGMNVDPFQFQAEPGRRLGIVWITRSPDTAAGHREYVAGLRQRFPGWNVWDYYADCPVREQVQIANLRGYGHNTVPHPEGMYPYQCPGVLQGTGTCGSRVMPNFMLWRAKGDPPRTADLLILESWPDADSRWSVGDLRRTARDDGCRSIAPLLTALADLCEIGASREGPAIALGLEHRVDLFRVGQAWRTGGRKDLQQLAHLPVLKRPRNPEMLVDSVLEDDRAWHQAGGLAGSQDTTTPRRVRIVGGVVRVRRARETIPPMLTEKPSIDLTGEARRRKLELVKYGIRVVTAEELLAGLEPPKVPRAERTADRIRQMEEIISQSPGVVPEKQAIAYALGVHKDALSRGKLAEAYAAIMAGHVERAA